VCPLGKGIAATAMDYCAHWYGHSCGRDEVKLQGVRRAFTV
jgi:hypothetical protein